MTGSARKLRLLLGVLLASLPAPAYYHFIHYLNGGNVPEKFDLTALPNKTVTFFVSENGPAIYGGTDTFNSVLSQLRQATTAWNNVASSDLRVAFGGLENLATAQSTPGGDVVFEDLQPGVYGFGGPTSLANPATAPNGALFVPIRRSVVHLNRNLTVLPGPSYNETFFMTAVHEMGHALGLQHTFTSATMSQATTRATTLSHPVDVDDVAGISVLYPNAAFTQFGSITGRVTTGKNGAHLTSVVAIRAGGGAVSALTNQDGTYRIDGIPAGQYFVYAHPLPPDADLFGPWNAAGAVVAGSGATNAFFYPGTTDLSQAVPVNVVKSQSKDGINITLASRPFVSIYDAGVYGFFNATSAVKPAYVNIAAGDTTVIAAGAGLGSNGQAPGLAVQFLGGSARIRDGGVRPFIESNGYTYVALDLGFNLGAGSGPQHLVFTTPDFMHVLPAGIITTQKSPPTVTGVSANGDGTLTLTGTNWNADSLIYFDGLPAAISTLDPVKGAATVTPPAGAGGQTAVLTVYNMDGQNSQLVQSAAPRTFTYGNSAVPLIVSVSPASLPAGAEAAVDVTTAGFSLAGGQVALGFGTTDVVVRRVFVLGPNHLQADLSVAANAVLSALDVSVISGFQVATAPAGFQITPALSGQPFAIPVLTNTAPGLNGSWPGASVTLYGTNLLNGTPSVTIGGQPALILSASAKVINLQVPAGLPPGAAPLNLNNGAANAYPVLVDIDASPASVVALQNTGGDAIDVAHPARPGDLVVLNLSNFAPAGSVIAMSRVQIGVGGVLRGPLQIAVLPSGVWQISFLLAANDQFGAAQPLIVYLDGRSSYPAAIPIARPDGTFSPYDSAANPDPTEGSRQ